MTQVHIWGKERRSKILRYGQLVDREAKEDDHHIDLKVLFKYGDWVERSKVRPLCKCFGKEKCECDRPS